MENKSKVNLTVMFIAHKDILDWVGYLNEINNEISNDVDLFLVYDNELLDEERSLVNEGIKIIDGENKGKLKAVLSASLQVNTKFIKIIDSDDCLNIENLKKINDELSEISDSTFVFHSAAQIRKNDKNYGLQTIDKKLISEITERSEDFNALRIPNSQSILNTKVLQKISNISDSLLTQPFFNDDFMSIAVQLLTKDKIKIDTKPYIHYAAHGQTSKPAFLSKKKKSAYADFYFNLNILKKMNADLNFENLNGSYEMFLKHLKRQSKQFGPLFSRKLFRKSKEGLDIFWENK